LHIRPFFPEAEIPLFSPSFLTFYIFYFCLPLSAQEEISLLKKLISWLFLFPAKTFANKSVCGD